MRLTPEEHERRVIVGDTDGRFWCVDVGAALSGAPGGLVRDPGDAGWRAVHVGEKRGAHTPQRG